MSLFYLTLHSNYYIQHKGNSSFLLAKPSYIINTTYDEPRFYCLTEPMERIVLGVGLATVITLDCVGVTLLKRFVISNDIKLLLSQKPNWIAALLVRILIVIGCFVFVVIPSSGYELGIVGLMGGFFGLIIYGIYECTNKALLFAWNRKLVIWDILRGIFLCACTSMMMGWAIYQ